mgnify:CR=1 FL=1
MKTKLLTLLFLLTVAISFSQTETISITWNFFSIPDSDEDSVVNTDPNTFEVHNGKTPVNCILVLPKGSNINMIKANDIEVFFFSLLIILFDFVRNCFAVIGKYIFIFQ